MTLKTGDFVRTQTWDEYTGLTGVVMGVDNHAVMRYRVSLDHPAMKKEALFYREELEVIE